MKITLALYSLLVLVPSVAYGVLVTFPEKKVLEQRLNDKGFDHFEEKVHLSDKLANQTKEAIEIPRMVDLALHDYAVYMQKGGLPKKLLVNTITLMSMRKGQLFETLLQDSPEALAELEQEGLYQPQSKK